MHPATIAIEFLCVPYSKGDSTQPGIVVDSRTTIGTMEGESSELHVKLRQIWYRSVLDILHHFLDLLKRTFFLRRRIFGRIVMVAGCPTTEPCSVEDIKIPKR